MNIIKKTIRNWLFKNSYAGARQTRLTYDWPTDITSAGSILRADLRTLRSRSRDLVINNDYARQFLWLVAKHVVGPNGFGFQNKAKYGTGILDKQNNDRIEEAWALWNEAGSFDVTGRLCGMDGDRLCIQSVARDGEILVRIVTGWDNPSGFALQFIEADHLDESLNIARLQNGNHVRMGVEFDPWQRPVAYHLLTEHPGDYVWNYQSRTYVRVPAEQIIHPFIIERINQPRGVPWMHSAMTRLNNIGAYEEAEIIGARVGASAMGIWEPDPTADVLAAPGQDAVDTDETPLTEMEPGIFVKAPLGYKFQPFNPGHPNNEFSAFMKSTLRGISSGLLVSYNTLASDLEGVNYSSIRAGVLEERDMWKLIQQWMIRNYKLVVFKRWYNYVTSTGRLDLPFGKVRKLYQPRFIPRTWAWVDPEKDIKANVTALDNLLTTRTDLASEQGDDFEEILIKLREEQELMKKYGIEVKEKEKAESRSQNSESKSEEKGEDDDQEAKTSRTNGNGGSNER